MGWKTNPIMEWQDPRDDTWVKISDHGRSPLNVSVERIENKQRMTDATLRRYVVAKKRTFSATWDNFPSIKNLNGTLFLANGDWAGMDMEDFHDDVDDAFRMRLRAGTAQDSEILGQDILELDVMMTDFSKEIVKRGKALDLWSISITLEEV